MGFGKPSSELQSKVDSLGQNSQLLLTRKSLTWRTMHGEPMGVLQSLLWSQLSRNPPNRPTPPNPQPHKLPLSMPGVGAVVEGTIGEGEAEEAKTVAPIIIKMHHRQTTIRHPTLPPKTIRKVQNTRTYRPVRGGRALSTGRKGGGRHTVVTRWCASGSM